MTWVPKAHLGTVVVAGVVGGIGACVAPTAAVLKFDDSSKKFDHASHALIGGMIGMVPGIFVGMLGAGLYNGAKVKLAASMIRRTIPTDVPQELAGLRQQAVADSYALGRNLTPGMGGIDNARLGKLLADIEFLRMAGEAPPAAGGATRW